LAARTTTEKSTEGWSLDGEPDPVLLDRGQPGLEIGLNHRDFAGDDVDLGAEPGTR
jgi:hypothetical protein